MVGSPGLPLSRQTPYPWASQAVTVHTAGLDASPSPGRPLTPGRQSQCTQQGWMPPPLQTDPLTLGQPGGHSAHSRVGSPLSRQTPYPWASQAVTVHTAGLDASPSPDRPLTPGPARQSQCSQQLCKPTSFLADLLRSGSSAASMALEMRMQASTTLLKYEWLQIL